MDTLPRTPLWQRLGYWLVLLSPVWMGISVFLVGLAVWRLWSQS